MAKNYIRTYIHIHIHIDIYKSKIIQVSKYRPLEIHLQSIIILIRLSPKVPLLILSNVQMLNGTRLMAEGADAN